MVKFVTRPQPQRPENDPLGDLQSLEFGPIHWRVILRSPAWRPPTDVYETEEAIVVRVEIAGMREEDFLIELNDRILSIRGTRPEAAERRAFHQMEIRFGEFSSELELPSPVDPESVEANYRDGLLMIILPKVKPRQVSVE